MAGEGSAASIANAGELSAKNAELREAWDHAPSTPPAAEPPPAAPPAAPPAPDTPPVDAPPAAAPPTPPPTAEAVQEFIDALVGEGETPETLKIPANARIPLTIDGKVEYVTAGELRKRGMQEADYTRSKQQLAEERAEVEEHAGRLIADNARLAARRAHVDDEAKRIREAMASPEGMERYENHMRLLAEDPEYKRTYEDALAGRELKAELGAEEAARHQELVGEGVAQAATWMLELATRPEYKGVDLERVNAIYADQLSTGQAALDRSHIERIFKAEADQAQRAVAPLQEEVARLRDQVNALTGQAVAAEAHNKGTTHALARAAAPPVAAGQGAAPAAADRKVKPFAPQNLADVNAEWNKRRD